MAKLIIGTSILIIPERDEELHNLSQDSIGRPGLAQWQTGHNYN